MKNDNTQAIESGADAATLPRWMTLDEAAAYARVTTRTIRRWRSVGLLRASKPAGGRALIDRDSLVDFIERACQ